MADQWNSARVGFIGAGQMARALARGMVTAGLVTPDRIIASDVSRPLSKNLVTNQVARSLSDRIPMLLTTPTWSFWPPNRNP